VAVILELRVLLIDHAHYPSFELGHCRAQGDARWGESRSGATMDNRRRPSASIASLPARGAVDTLASRDAHTLELFSETDPPTGYR
jgi:hypothetical protein